MEQNRVWSLGQVIEIFLVAGLKLYGDQTISCSCHLVPFALCDEWHVCLLSGSNMGLLQYTFAFETRIMVP